MEILRRELIEFWIVRGLERNKTIVMRDKTANKSVDVVINEALRRKASLHAKPCCQAGLGGDLLGSPRRRALGHGFDQVPRQVLTEIISEI